MIRDIYRVMPNYDHECQDDSCKHQWEDTYSINTPPPTTCPKCGKETAQRMISLGSKGVVELTGKELLAKLQADAKQLVKDARKDEKLYANLLGEAKYQDLQTRLDRRKR